MEKSETENADIVEDSGITMLDVLEQQKEMEEEYAAVLGGSDEKCCTYDQGAVKRQALYSCLTCCPEARNDLKHCAGICLACSYRCHESHDLVELYTKRNFRCDCPTVSLGANRCVLNAAAVPKPRNTENAYNQNFQGVYCTCHRPYPDPERTCEEEMLQCAICEDWFHLQHLEAPPKVSNLVEVCNQMICGDCMKLHSFLVDYTGLSIKTLEDLDESAANITVSGDLSLCEDNDNKLRSDLDKSISEIMNMGESVATATEQAETDAADVSEPKTKRQKTENPEEQPETVQESTENKCRRPTKKVDYEKGATFWASNWREALCRCDTCLELYRVEKVEYLIDAEDTVESYEARGIKRAETESSTYEHGIRALASIGHVQQIDAITEYNRMKDKLKTFLHTFAVNKKVVTEEDINQFFAQMRNEKNTNLGQPHFCR